MFEVRQKKVVYFCLINFMLIFNCNTSSKVKINSNCKNSDEIIEYYNTFKKNPQHNVLALPIEIISDYSSKHLNVENYANLMVKLSDELTDLSSIYNSEIELALTDGSTAKAILSKNSTFCEVDLINIHKNFIEKYNSSIYIHVWENPDNSKSDTLYTVYNYSLYSR